MITQERLKQLWDYDPDTGKCVWKQSTGFKRLVDKPVGYLHRSGYICAGIDNQYYGIHRLIWLYMTGTMPPNEVDHINGNRQDNRFCNLRLATKKQNQQNRKKQNNNKTGITGVGWHKDSKKWAAYIKHNLKNIHLGIYDDIWDAICVRKSAELTYQPLRAVAN